MTKLIVNNKSKLIEEVLGYSIESFSNFQLMRHGYHMYKCDCSELKFTVSKEAMIDEFIAKKIYKSYNVEYGLDNITCKCVVSYKKFKKILNQKYFKANPNAIIEEEQNSDEEKSKEKINAFYFLYSSNRMKGLDFTIIDESSEYSLHDFISSRNGSINKGLTLIRGKSEWIISSSDCSCGKLEYLKPDEVDCEKIKDQIAKYENQRIEVKAV